MGRGTFEAVIDPWPQDGVVVRVNWPRVVFALLPATMILLALGFQAGQTIPSPSAATEVSTAPKGESSSLLQLVEVPASQGTDSRLPLGVLVSGPSELASTAAIEIIDLPSGWALSEGRPLGNRWRIPAAKLSGAVILPPRRFSGAVDVEVELRLADDTLVERRSVHWAWAVTQPGLAPERLVPERLAPEKLGPDKLGPEQRAAEKLAPEKLVPEKVASEKRASEKRVAENTTLLLSRAEGLLVQGDFAGARLVLRRAAEAGDARAALLLGGTYEGCLLAYSLCTDADRTEARYWYEMAADFGSAEARQRLDRLASKEPGGGLSKSSMSAPTVTGVSLPRR
jgi:hypothetical protein